MIARKPPRWTPTGTALVRPLPGLGQTDAPPAATVGDIKAQSVRMADVWVFGPLMIYSALGKSTPTWVRAGMLIVGIGTIAYNLYNYFAIERRAQLSGINPNLTPGAGSSDTLRMDSRIAP